MCVCAYRACIGEVKRTNRKQCLATQKEDSHWVRALYTAPPLATNDIWFVVRASLLRVKMHNRTAVYVCDSRACVSCALQERRTTLWVGPYFFFLFNMPLSSSSSSLEISLLEKFRCRHCHPTSVHCMLNKIKQNRHRQQQQRAVRLFLRVSILILTKPKFMCMNVAMLVTLSKLILFAHSQWHGAL